MWSDEKEELINNIKESTITALEWMCVWTAMMALILSIM